MNGGLSEVEVERMGRLLDIRALGEVLAEVLAFIHEIEFPHVGEVMCCRGTSLYFPHLLLPPPYHM